jgi:hypothetical protein
MSAPPVDPDADDAPYCERHNVSGRPGEPWQGWRCPKCEAAARPGLARALVRDLRALGSTLWYCARQVGGAVLGWIFVVAAIVALIVWLIAGSLGPDFDDRESNRGEGSRDVTGFA